MNLAEGKKLVIMGVGNVLLMDEGVGVHTINEMKKLDLDDEIELIDGGTSGMDVLSLIEADRIIVVDAVKADAEPGTIFKFKPDDIKDASRKKINVSLHDVGLLQSIRMAELIGRKPEVTIFGIVPKDYSECSLEMTPELTGKLPRLIELVLEEAEAILGKSVRNLKQNEE